MKSFISVILVHTLAATTHAQSIDMLTSQGSRFEIAQAFASTIVADADYFSILHNVKDNSLNVAVLSAIVYEPLDGSYDESQSRHIKHSAALSLDLIGSEEAYAALIGAANSHSDPEVRGTALMALAHHYIARVYEDSLPPSLDIVQLLYLNADDDSNVRSKEATIGRIAREGFKLWTGIELGEDVSSTRRVILKNEGREVSIQEYRQMAWEKLKDLLVWNEEKGMYDVMKKVVTIEEIEE